MSTAAKKKKNEKACWFVRNDQGEQYGPVDLQTLKAWAMDGRVAPTNEISSNGSEWQLVTGLRDLNMDWVAEVTPGTFYGPIHHKAMDELIKDDVLKAEAVFFVRREFRENDAGDIQGEDLTAQLTAAQKKVLALESDLKRLHEKQASEVSELTRVRQELTRVSDQAVTLLAKETSLTGSLAEQTKRFDSELCQWKQSVQRAESISSERASRIADLEGELAGLKRAVTLRAEAEARVETLEKELSSLRAELKQTSGAVKTHCAHVQELESALADAQRKLAAVTKASDELRQEQDMAHKGLADAQQRNQEVLAVLRQAIDLLHMDATNNDPVRGKVKPVNPSQVIEAEVLGPEPEADKNGRPPVVKHTRQARPGLSLADLEQQARRELERLGAQGKNLFKKK